MATPNQPQDFESLHKDHVRMARQGFWGAIAAAAGAGTLIWLMWTWAGDAHAQTEVNKSAIESIEERLTKLDETMASNLMVTNDLREEVSALRTENRASRDQRERIIDLLDDLNERLRDVEEDG